MKGRNRNRVALLLLLGGAVVYGAGAEENPNPPLTDEQVNELASQAVTAYKEAKRKEITEGYTVQSASAIAATACTLTSSFLDNISAIQASINERMESDYLPFLDRDNYHSFVEADLSYLQNKFEFNELELCEYREILWRLFYRHGLNRNGSIVFPVPTRMELNPQEYLEALAKLACDDLSTILQDNPSRSALKGIMGFLQDGIAGGSLVKTNLKAPPSALPVFVQIGGRVISVGVGVLIVKYAVDDLKSPQ